MNLWILFNSTCTWHYLRSKFNAKRTWRRILSPGVAKRFLRPQPRSSIRYSTLDLSLGFSPLPSLTGTTLRRCFPVFHNIWSPCWKSCWLQPRRPKPKRIQSTSWLTCYQRRCRMNQFCHWRVVVMSLAGVDFYRMTVLQSMKLGIDVNRHKEILVKAVAAVLLLLLKHFKLNHVYQFEFMSQHLVFANCIPLVLKFFNQNIMAYIGAKNK